ncbi:hypothetical protein BGZ81_002386 [Podila clonocystis]|nr:hypothetical protein BGZ81_002386 [Podila clonocystis]
MLSQRFIPASAERWADRDERDSSFNVMSPVGRNRHYKGLSLPSKKMGMVWDHHPMSITNTISGNNHHRDETGAQVWGLEAFQTSAPQDIEGVSYVYHKGPAGQTPFPTLIAMNGYFPSTQPALIPQPQAQLPPHQSHHHHSHNNIHHQGFQPYPISSPPRSSFLHNQQYPSQVQSQKQQQLPQRTQYRKRFTVTNAKKEQGDFWSRAYPVPETQPQPLTREQLQMWHYHHDQIQPFIL